MAYPLFLFRIAIVNIQLVVVTTNNYEAHQSYRIGFILKLCVLKSCFRLGPGIPCMVDWPNIWSKSQWEAWYVIVLFVLNSHDLLIHFFTIGKIKAETVDFQLNKLILNIFKLLQHNNKKVTF